MDRSWASPCLGFSANPIHWLGAQSRQMVSNPQALGFPRALSHIPQMIPQNTVLQRVHFNLSCVPSKSAVHSLTSQLMSSPYSSPFRGKGQGPFILSFVRAMSHLSPSKTVLCFPLDLFLSHVRYNGQRHLILCRGWLRHQNFTSDSWLGEREILLFPYHMGRRGE